MNIKNKKPSIKIIGNNGDNVTGSIILVTTTKGTQILLECGIVQGEGSMEDDYRINSKALNGLELDKIKYCFLLHSHSDHILLTPRAVAQGMKEAKIISTPITAKIGKELWLDGAFINKTNAKYLSDKYKKEILPLYYEDDIYKTLDNLYEYNCGEMIDLDDEISFKLLKNNHVIGASSLELFIKNESGHIFKLFYSSDLGNVSLDNRPYVQDSEYTKGANVCIFESTYGEKENYITKKDRKKEIELLKSIIEEHCLKQKAVVMLPCFSFSRSQEIMTILYQLFKDDERFEHIDFVVDSNLTRKISKVYTEVLKGKDIKLFNEVLNWKNFKIISDYNKETLLVLKDQKQKVVISSSGMASQGHAKEYIKQYITNPNNAIVTCGYSTPSTLAGKLQTDEPTVTIDLKEYTKKAKVYALSSFSSHMQRKDLINYICGVNTEKVVLVHGSKQAKASLKLACDEKLSEMNKTTKIIISKKNMIIGF